MNAPLLPAWPTPDEDSTREQPVESPDVVACWRCGKEVLAATPRCPYCAAPLTQEPVSHREETAASDDDAKTLTRLLVFFCAMLGISLFAGAVRHFEAALAPHHPLQSEELLLQVFGLEAIDTVLVLAAWAWVGMRRREPHHSWFRRVSVWTLSLPALALTLVLNVCYHRCLLQWLTAAPHKMIWFQDRSLVAAWSMAICFQPAVIEELFFRYLMFGALRSVMGGHTVVWVTAAMFALAHIGVPLSMPVLFVLGILLGYARLASGGIYLPMALHFVHNAIVMALNANIF
jgi:membrane protease YdiL (CAAX protease family)